MSGSIYGTSPQISLSGLPHEDSVFSAVPPESPAMMRNSTKDNPFGGDAKKSLIKKINTEAYLGTEMNSVARYTSNQNSLNTGSRLKTQMENQVLGHPTSNEFSTEMTNSNLRASNHKATKALLKNMSDANFSGSHFQATTAAVSQQTAAASKQQRTINLNHRSGDINNNRDNLNSLRLKNAIKSNKANLAFGQSYRSGQESSDNADLN